MPVKTPSDRTQPVITSERLVLRPLRADDVALLAKYSSDKRVAFGTRSIPHPLPPEASATFINAAMADDREEDVWAIDGTETYGVSLLGVISLKALDRSQSQIGYWIAPDYWHSGVASEAVRVLLDNNPRDNRTVFAEVFQDNPVSARILTHAGFEYIGDAEAFAVSRNCAVPTWTYLRLMG